MSKSKEELKNIVQSSYNLVAENSDSNLSCCSKDSCCTDNDFKIFSEDYSKLNGYNPSADLSLGCGMPTEFANIKEGDTVLDLGSGAGNDCFVARSIVGESGKIIGLDFADNMLAKARENARKLNYSNISFIKGDIENIPLDENLIDVVISNCVLNLVPDKKKAFNEIYKVLKPGAHFTVSDVVLEGELPVKLKEAADLYAGCIGGAIQQNDYLNIIKEFGFKNVKVLKVKEVNVPDNIFLNVISSEELESYKTLKAKILSITVSAKK
jgi:arsenite methyltransferase